MHSMCILFHPILHASKWSDHFQNLSHTLNNGTLPFCKSSCIPFMSFIKKKVLLILWSSAGLDKNASSSRPSRIIRREQSLTHLSSTKNDELQRVLFVATEQIEVSLQMWAARRPNWTFHMLLCTLIQLILDSQIRSMTCEDHEPQTDWLYYTYKFILDCCHQQCLSCFFMNYYNNSSHNGYEEIAVL